MVMRLHVVLCLGVLTCACGCESTNVIKPPALPDSLTVSGIVWMGDSIPAKWAQVYTWPQHGVVYTDTLGQYALRISAATDSAEIDGFIPDTYGAGAFLKINHIAIPPDHRDVTLNFTLDQVL
jgi:hypothetical protein